MNDNRKGGGNKGGLSKGSAVAVHPSTPPPPPSVPSGGSKPSPKTPNIKKDGK